MTQIKLSPAEFQQLQQALSNAFPFDNQVIELSLYGVGIDLHDFVGPTAGKSQKLFMLIQEANALNKVGSLVAKARELNPDNSLLKKAAGDFTIHEQVEALVRDDPENFPDPEVLRDQMAERERAVCRIETKTSGRSKTGTGFLVGPSLVLTCRHVMSDVIEGKSAPGDVDIRFGYRILSDGTEVTGDRYRLADKWLLASSDESALDFALMSLSTNPEGRTLGTYQGAPQRRIIDLKQHRDGKPDNTIIAIQHPEGKHLKVTFGSVTQVDDKRISYSANTLPGSSGSPILLNDCTVTALHRQGSDQKSNAGIRISKIYPELTKDGFLP